MKRALFRRAAAVLLAVLLILPFAAGPGLARAHALTPEPVMEAEAAILVDMTTGKILYEHNSRQKMYPASTTKMITAILAIENLDMRSTITADAEVAAMTGTRMVFKDGEQMNAEVMLNTLLVASANDSALAIAKAIAGTESSFASMMNAKAKELGAENTHFVNSHGLHDDDHYTTAYDLSQIALGCLKNEMFASIVRQASYDVPATNFSKATTISSTNLLLYGEDEDSQVYVNGIKRAAKYDGCIGVKTGYTGKAGGCLVAAAERDGTKLLSVVLKSSRMGRFSDSIALLDWGFENYKTVRIMEAGQSLGTLKVKRGAVGKVEALLDQSGIWTVPVEATSAVMTTTVEFVEELTAPVEKGQVLGTVTMFENGKRVARYNAVAANAVARGGALSIFGIEDHTARIILDVVIIVVTLLCAILLVFVLLQRRKARIRKARRAAALEKKRAEEAERRKEWERQYRNRYRD